MTTLDFKPIGLTSRAEIQGVSLHAGLRNCNFTFANLYGWQPFFDTEFAIQEGVLVLRFRFGEGVAHMICSPQTPWQALIEELADSEGHVVLLGMEDERAAEVASFFGSRAEVTPMRNSYDYLYLRSELAEMQGKSLKNKRNHVNKFHAEHPNFEYMPLSADRFDECRALEELWRGENDHSNPDYMDTLTAEHDAMERIFTHWGELGMMGGCIMAEGRMVAFTYGAPVTCNTIDVCVEKADRQVDGAFSIINQQFAAHLPAQYHYLNREEDMGLEGLRKAKLSYHPEQLITYNQLDITL